MNFLFNINVCRVCMQNEQTNDLLNDKLLLEKFEFTTRLAVSEKDNLPKFICSKCSTRLIVAYTFIKTARESEYNLKAFIEKINTDFKEVSQGNKSVKKQLNDQNLTEDEILSLMDYEDCENIVNNREIKEKCKASISQSEYKDKQYKADNHDDSNGKADNISKSTLKPKEDNIDNLKNRSVYRLTEDILLISDNRNEIDNEFENNTQFMDISNSDEEEGIETRHFTNEVQGDVLDQDKTLSGTSILTVHDEIECQSQSTELGVEDSEENQNYEKLINSQVEGLNFASIYADDNSAEDTHNKEDTYYLTHINEDVKNIAEEKQTSDLSIMKEQEGIAKKLSHKNYGHRFYCEKCNRDFSTKTNLNRHMQSHEGNKRFSCTECDKNFTQKSTLKQHMYTHTGERPYVCEVCNRGFTQCKSLIFHMRRHTGEKPFHCEYCLLTFRQKDALRNHILKHHVVVEQISDGSNIFSCIICQKKFDTKVEFKNHMKAHTAAVDVDNVVDFIKTEQENSSKKIVQDGNTNLLIPINSECIDAAVVDISASSAAEPSRAKKFQCRKCFKCFALKKSFVRHLRIHFTNNVNKLSECLDCDLQFSTNALYQEHLTECHQYACSGCPGIIFKTLDDLKVHMFEHDLDHQER